MIHPRWATRLLHAPHTCCPTYRIPPTPARATFVGQTVPTVGADVLGLYWRLPPMQNTVLRARAVCHFAHHPTHTPAHTPPPPPPLPPPLPPGFCSSGTHLPPTATPPYHTSPLLVRYACGILPPAPRATTTHTPFATPYHPDTDTLDIHGWDISSDQYLTPTTTRTPPFRSSPLLCLLPWFCPITGLLRHHTGQHPTTGHTPHTTHFTLLPIWLDGTIN